MAIKDRTNNNINDARGKLHEVSTLYSFSGNVWSNTVHYRNDGETPLDIFNICSNTIGHEATVEIMEASHGTFLNIVNELTEAGIMSATNAYWDAAWTSREDSVGTQGDHEKYTGIKDLNSEADIMIKTETGPIGFSLKYGTSKNITLKNPGRNYFDNLLGDLDLDRHKIKHDLFVEQLGYYGNDLEKHQQYKEDKNSDRAKKAVESSLEYRKLIAEDIRSELSKLDSDSIKDIVLNLCANKTIFPHFRSHTRKTKSGMDYHLSSIIEYSNQRARLYDNWFIDTDQESTTITFRARNIQYNTIDVVARISIKTKSGPMTLWGGNFNAPMLTDKKRAKKVLYVFDLDDTLFWYIEHESPRVLVKHKEDHALIAELSPSSYSKYEKHVDHYFDYFEFKSSQIFRDIAKPVHKMIDKLKRLIDDGREVIILTARNGIDDLEHFKETLNDHEIDTEKVRIFMSGILKINDITTAQAKKMMLKDIINDEKYDNIIFWDDNLKNLEECLLLEKEIEGLKIEARLVRYNVKKSTLSIKKVNTN